MQTLRWFALTLGIASFPSMAAVDEIPGYAVEMGSKRVDDRLFRYTRFNAESPYPCLRLELIAPQEEWKVMERKDVCEMNGMSLDGDFSYGGFNSFRFENDYLFFKFTFYKKVGHGEFVQDCSIRVSDNKMGELKCDVPVLLNH